MSMEVSRVCQDSKTSRRRCQEPGVSSALKDRAAPASHWLSPQSAQSEAGELPNARLLTTCILQTDSGCITLLTRAGISVAPPARMQGSSQLLCGVSSQHI